MKIERLHALEILDSRGNPTLSVSAELDGSVHASAQVPSGASTGHHEAVELRDGDEGRYAGRGVRRAVEIVNDILSPALRGMDAEDFQALDRRMIELDGTPNKSRLGANSILGVSCAVARAGASARRVPLWRWLAGSRPPALPMPMVNIISGGLHAGANIEFQDFLVIPIGAGTFHQAMEMVTAVHRSAGALIEAERYLLTGVADEGGWGPWLESNERAVELLTRAIEQAGYRPGEEAAIALDVASTHFYNQDLYHLAVERRTLNRSEMTELLVSWRRRYPILSIEDGMSEDDWEGWRALTRALGASTQLIGDDLFTTNIGRLERGIAEKAANAVLVKMNQIGTLTETFQVIDRAREAGFRAVISARSGETEDSFLADLAVASGAGQIKVGSVTRSERLAKYNRLLEIEAQSGMELARPFPGMTTAS
jgi:enolase